MLEIRGITKRFDKKLVLENISAQFASGKIHGLLGPNGAGKTSLIRIINQMILADQGEILWNGKVPNRDFLHSVGYLPEERGLYTNMKVGKHLEFIGKLKGMSRDQIASQKKYWLSKFEIESWENVRIEELSKGMAQKIQFIVAVFNDPEILILDEPFSGFDPSNIVLIRRELKSFREAGKTILLSTHNMNNVEELCDNVLMIHESKKVVEGKVSTIKNERKNGLLAVQFQGNLMAFVNALWTGFEFVDKKIIAEDRFIARVRGLHGNELKELLKTTIDDVKIEAAWEELPSMEEIFIELIDKKNLEHEK